MRYVFYKVSKATNEWAIDVISDVDTKRFIGQDPSDDCVRSVERGELNLDTIGDSIIKHMGTVFSLYKTFGNPTTSKPDPAVINNEGELVCPHCGKKMKSKSGYTLHLKKHG